MKHRISKGKLLIIGTLSLFIIGMSANAARTPDAPDSPDSIDALHPGSPWWYSSPGGGTTTGLNRTGGIFLGSTPADASPTTP
jgi:hypothetical protein